MSYGDAQSVGQERLKYSGTEALQQMAIITAAIGGKKNNS